MSLVNQIIRLDLPASLSEFKGVLETFKKYLRVSFSKQSRGQLDNSPNDMGKLDHVLISYLIGLFFIQRLFQSNDDKARDKLITMIIQLLEVIKGKYINEIGYNPGVLKYVFDQDTKEQEKSGGLKEYKFADVMKDSENIRLFLNYIALQNYKTINEQVESNENNNNNADLNDSIVDTILLFQASSEMYPYTASNESTSSNDVEKPQTVESFVGDKEEQSVHEDGNSVEDDKNSNEAITADSKTDISTDQNSDDVVHELTDKINVDKMDKEMSELEAPLDSDLHQSFLRELQDIETDIKAMKFDSGEDIDLLHSGNNEKKSALASINFNDLNISRITIDKFIEHLTELLLSSDESNLTAGNHNDDEQITDEQIEKLINEIANKHDDYPETDGVSDIDDDFDGPDYMYDENTGVYLKKTEYLNSKLPSLNKATNSPSPNAEQTPLDEKPEDKSEIQKKPIVHHNRLNEKVSAKSPIDKAKLIKETENSGLLESSIKHCKFAVSSLQMEDLVTAKLDLQAAMDLIALYEEAIK